MISPERGARGQTDQSRVMGQRGQQGSRKGRNRMEAQASQEQDVEHGWARNRVKKEQDGENLLES